MIYFHLSLVITWFLSYMFDRSDPMFEWFLPNSHILLINPLALSFYECSIMKYSTPRKIWLEGKLIIIISTQKLTRIVGSWPIIIILILFNIIGVYLFPKLQCIIHYIHNPVLVLDFRITMIVLRFRRLRLCEFTTVDSHIFRRMFTSQQYIWLRQKVTCYRESISTLYPINDLE
jgi:hypothetical protein